MNMRDEKALDQKNLAILIGDPHYHGLREIGDIGQQWLLELP